MTAGTVAALYRYPVKSMLGEPVAEIAVGPLGVAGDRRFALLDEETGRVATAKHPRRWRQLLQCRSATASDGVRVTLPDGRSLDASDADEELSALLGRRVRMAGERPEGAEVERPDPVDVLAEGVDAEVDYAILEIAQGTPGGAFVDHSPVHLITTATLDAIGIGAAEAIRYRPNVVIQTPEGYPPFSENDWPGREITLGEVRLRATLPTPRCSVPTLEHGSLGRAPEAVRPLLEHRVEVPGFGVLPCAGVYAEVLAAGTVRAGDEVRVGE
ncbi:MOSC domain-containing protein [Pseudonocardia sp. RS11V-5]|uniref:MOSC domain-containing protein n=1 Tax=Pseudonocardia terrae TaxID=2905831 RepID=UPI001E63F1CD|nr:MOSC N-terminal beta barrel domain-containing protein [Pseudonocardia terrae]MCE3550266.1 MOSC domain-containing protein [Pseudonocardia terrae]